MDTLDKQKLLEWCEIIKQNSDEQMTLMSCSTDTLYFRSAGAKQCISRLIETIESGAFDIQEEQTDEQS